MNREDFEELLSAYRGFLNLVEPGVLEELERQSGIPRSELLNELKHLLFDVGPRS